jgi:hypothetical protein
MTLRELLFRRMRRAAAFIIIGMLIQAATFVWAHPAAFLLFTLIGGTLMFIGMAIFLAGVIHPRPWAAAYRLLRQTPPEVTAE